MCVYIYMGHLVILEVGAVVEAASDRRAVERLGMPEPVPCPATPRHSSLFELAISGCPNRSHVLSPQATRHCPVTPRHLSLSCRPVPLMRIPGRKSGAELPTHTTCHTLKAFPRAHDPMPCHH